MYYIFECCKKLHRRGKAFDNQFNLKNKIAKNRNLFLFV